MKKNDEDYLEKLASRLTGYSSPTDAQQLILTLYNKGTDSRTSDDNRILATLLRAEKQSEKLALARADARAVIDAEKRNPKRLDNQKKIIWGATFRKFAENDENALNVMQAIWMSGYINEKDKELLSDDYESIINKFNNNRRDR